MVDIMRVWFWNASYERYIRFVIQIPLKLDYTVQHVIGQNWCMAPNMHTAITWTKNDSIMRH